MEKINKYNKKYDYSYTLGAFPSLELINKAKNLIELVLISEDYIEKDQLIKRLKEENIAYKVSSKQVSRLADKGNVFVVTLFKKFKSDIREGNHIFLNEVSDMGNLGTIIRTMAGMGFYDLVLVGNCCDIFNPKTVRASMGAIFSLRFRHYEKIEDYIRDFPQNKLYMFMLSKNEDDSIYHLQAEKNFTIVMGNEGRGLPKDYAVYGKMVFIPQSSDIDSFNLPIATAIAMHEFRRFI
ncbi:TrmH family RNA methyltransferase [Peptoniphilaceae bacterium SGI.131]